MEYQLCQEPCTGSAYLVENGICVSECTTGVYEAQGEDLVCIEEDDCASRTFRCFDIKKCVEKCDADTYFTVVGDKKYCYGTCPNG